MIKAFLVVLFAFCFKSSFGQDKDIEQITKLNKSWLDLTVKKDTAVFSQIFADDFVLISPSGNKVTKQNVVKNILTQELKSVIIDSLDVKLLTNNIGLVTCYITFVVPDNGKDMTGKNCYQDIYIKRKNRWYAIAAHVTMLSYK